MSRMYASVFSITRDEQRDGIRVIAIVACDKTTLETLTEMMGNTKDWPDSQFAFSEGPGCTTVLVKTSNANTIDVLNELYAGREESFVFLTAQVERSAPDCQKLKLGDKEYFFTKGSSLLRLAPEEKPSNSTNSRANQPEPNHSFSGQLQPAGA